MKIASMRFWENENDYRSLSNEQLQALSAALTGGPELDTPRWESLVVTGLERENLSFRPQMSVSTRSAYARTAGFSLSRRGACRLRGIAERLTRSAAIAIRSISLFFEPHGWYEVC